MTTVTFKNIGQLVTLEPLFRESRYTNITEKDLGALANAWLICQEGKVHSYGQGNPPQVEGNIIDVQGGLVMPGLVDAHTHPVFAGSREDEFAQRLDGRTYQEIAASGGGILSSVLATQKATQSELKDIGRINLERFLKNGVTTVEAKSGYGQDVASELKILRAISELKSEGPQTIKATCLGLHAKPKNIEMDDFLKQMTEELLPRAAEENLADYADAFVENGYFSVEQCDSFFQKAKELGIGIRIHADEFADSGAASASAKWGALSADHLEKASKEGILAMGKAGVAATILPGTSLYCAMEYTDARPFKDAGCPVVLSTDFNPGSCRSDNLAFIACIGALNCHLTTAEAVAAVTIVPAMTLNLEKDKGHLSKGADGDLLVYAYPTVRAWISDLGQQKPNQVWISGELVSST